MKITKMVCIPYTNPSRGAQRGAIPQKPGERPIPPGPRAVLLKIYTDEGIVGIGEAGMSSLGYAGDTVDSTLGFLKVAGPALLLGEDPMKIELLTAKLDRVAKYSFQAMAVVDCALHDIAGKKLGVPVYQLLGGKSIDKSPMGMIIATNDPEVAAQKAVDALKAGFKSLKVKCGALSQTNVQQDIANLTAIREAVGYDAKVGIDVNGGWNYFQALHALKKMEKFDLFMAEQPVPWKEIDNLARLRQKVGTPIAADESAICLADLLRIIERDAADLLFIKLGKVGGIRQAMKWSAVAKAAGLPIMCGALPSSAFETAWQLHFLVSDEWATHMEHENLGVTGPVTGDIAKEVPVVENGYMIPPEGPGLGLELDEELLESCTYKDMVHVIE